MSECLYPGESLYLDGTSLEVKLASDSRISLDPTDGIYLDDDELSTEWISWTPTFSGGTFVKGNAIVEAYYMRFGQLIFWKMAIELGSTSSMGTTGPYFTLPVAPATWGQVGTANQPLGFWMSYPYGYIGEIGQGGGSGATVGNLSAGGTYSIGSVLDTTTPFTWATGNTWVGQGFYERA